MPFLNVLASPVIAATFCSPYWMYSGFKSGFGFCLFVGALCIG